MKKHILLLMSFFYVSIVAGQNIINTGRSGLLGTAHSIGKKNLQVEFGSYYQEFYTNSGRAFDANYTEAIKQIISPVNIDIRYGIFNWLEINAIYRHTFKEVKYYDWNMFLGKGDIISDIYGLGLRFQLIKNKKLINGLALHSGFSYMAEIRYEPYFREYRRFRQIYFNEISLIGNSRILNKFNLLYGFHSIYSLGDYNTYYNEFNSGIALQYQLFDQLIIQGGYAKDFLMEYSDESRPAYITGGLFYVVKDKIIADIQGKYELNYELPEFSLNRKKVFLISMGFCWNFDFSKTSK